MDLSAQSGLLAAIVSAAVSIAVLLRGRRVLINRYFLAFSSNLFVHFFASFLVNFWDERFWIRVDLIAASLLPVTALLFFGHFLWKNAAVARPFMRTAYTLSGLTVVFLLTPWSDNPITTVAVVSYVFSVLYLCAYLIYIRQRELKSQREQVRLRYLLAVMLAAVTFVLLGMFPSPLAFLRSWGGLVAVFTLYFLSQSIVRARLLDVQELLGRGAVLIAVALILSVVFGILVYWMGTTPETSVFHTFVASFVILILFEPLRDKVESSTSLLFFRERYELRRKLDELRREIATILDPREMCTVMLDSLFDAMRINQSSVYFLEEGGASYYLVGHRGIEPLRRVDVAAHRALFDQLKKTPTIVLAETFERFLQQQGSLPEDKLTKEMAHARSILETLTELKAGVCIPFMGESEVLGFCTLRDESGAEGYTTEEIAHMVAVGEQAAVTIENSMMFAQIRERDRLAVLGEMAAGLAHEIRNPLGAIKGAAQYLDPATVSPDASEFLRIIIEETDRLNEVVNQFLDYSRPFKKVHEPTDVNQVVTQTTRLVSQGLEGKAIELVVELQPDLPIIQANPQQLTQVLLNLLHNAVEAMPGGGRIRVSTHHHKDEVLPRRRRATHPRVLPGVPEVVEIEVTDNGPGIPPEQLEHIFVPFFTTKEHGTGLGLAISQRIIEHHGGEIRLRSKVGDGATFTLVLPCDAGAPKEKPAQTPVDVLTTQELERQGGLPFPPKRSTQ